MLKSYLLRKLNTKLIVANIFLFLIWIELLSIEFQLITKGTKLL